jgi:hypothetical protein
MIRVHEPPLTPEERAELNRIRQNRQIRRQRAELDTVGNHFGKPLLAVAAIIVVGFWPILIWHHSTGGASWTPTTTGWIVEGVWLGVIVLPICGLIFYGHVRGTHGKRPGR